MLFLEKINIKYRKNTLMNIQYSPVHLCKLHNVFQNSIILLNLFIIVFHSFRQKFQNNHVTKVNKINEFPRYFSTYNCFDYHFKNIFSFIKIYVFLIFILLITIDFNLFRMPNLSLFPYLRL